MTDDIANLIRIDRASPLPLTRQIEQSLMALIENGSLRPGDRLPNEEDIGHHLQISRSPVAQAVGRLAEKGLLTRRKRAGTFVTERPRRCATVGFFYFRERAAETMNSIHHAQQLLDQSGFDLKLISFPFDFFETVDLLEEMTRRELVGAVLTPLYSSACRNQLLRLEEAQFPYVRLGNKTFIGELRAPLITGDNRRATRQVMEHLQRLGHERIGFIGHSKWPGYREEYLIACESRTNFQPRWVEHIHFDGTLTGWEALPAGRIAREYLLKNPDVTAVVLEHGGMAAKLAQEAQAMGRPVPASLSIVCIEDWTATCAAASPGIASVHLSKETEAELAVERLLRIIREGPAQYEEIVQVPYELIERDSIAPPCVGNRRE